MAPQVLGVILDPNTMFRINARNFSLTYPQTPAGFELKIQDFLNDLPNVAYYVIGTERHADGGLHQHVALGFTSKKNIRSQTFFDIDGQHPNIQSTRNITDWITYCKKDGNFIESGSVPRPKRSWSEVLSADTREEAERLVAEISPRDYILNNERIDYWLSKRYTTTFQGDYHPTFTEFNISVPMQAWADQRLNSDRPKSLILYGETRTGKTHWARSLGPHMYFNGMFDMSLWNPNAEYAIFDDFDDWSKFYSYKQWLGAQLQFTITDKYRKKSTIKWGKPTIILSNSLPQFSDQDWVRKNCFIVQVSAPLFI